MDAERAAQGRCDWCGTDPLYVAYHDTEWGVPEYDGRALWKKWKLVREKSLNAVFSSVWKQHRHN